MEEEINETDVDYIENCIICLEEDTIENLLLPCNCSEGYVHKHCLRSWRRRFPNMHVHRVRCAVCKYDYTVPVSGYTVRVEDNTQTTLDVRDGGTPSTSRSRTSMRCKIIFIVQFCYIINTMGTFVYFLIWNPMYFLKLVTNEWRRMHVLFSIQFFQGVTQLLQYAYLALDPMVFIATSALYCYFVIYCPSLLLAGNILFSIFSIFRLCLLYDI